VAAVIVRLALVRDAAGQPAFFLPLVFDDLTSSQSDETIVELAQGGSATPEFASVAPVPDELAYVLDQLAFDRVSYISGGSGEGKSTLAYHAARELSCSGYTTYELCGPVLEGFSREYIRDKLLAQADNLQGKARLILVDDAHLLEWADDVREILLSTLIDGDTDIIWVWTDYPELPAGREFDDAAVRIDYVNLAAKQADFLQSNFDNGKLNSSQAALEEAADLSKMGVIRTAWQYSFVAYGGSKRLAAGLASLARLEIFVLFELSARTVAMGALGMPIPEAQSLLYSTSIGWVHDDVSNQSYKQVLYDLAHRSDRHEQFVRVDTIDKLDPEVACLHYNFAREVVRGSIYRTAIAADLIKALDAVITGADIEELPYLAVLCRDIGPFLGAFVARQADFVTRYIDSAPKLHFAAAAEVVWILVQGRDDPRLQTFVTDLNADRIAARINVSSSAEMTAVANMLRYLGPITTVHKDLLNSLDLDTLATVASSAQSSQLSGVADLLRELGTRRAEMLGKLDIGKLESAANSARPPQLPGLAYLLRELGTRRAEMLGKLDIGKLASVASSARPSDFSSVADLLRELGTRRTEMLGKRAEMLGKLDIGKLASAANSARLSELGYIAELLRELGDRRSQFLEKLDLDVIGSTGSDAKLAEFGSLAILLGGLGNQRRQLINKLGIAHLIDKANHASAADLRRVADLLWEIGEHRRALFDSKVLPRLNLIKLANVISGANPGELGSAARFIETFGRGRSAITVHIDVARMAENASRAHPAEFTFIAALLRQLGERRGEFLRALNVKELAAAVGRARPVEFSSVADLLRLLDERHDEFVDALNVSELAAAASHAQARDLRGVAVLLQQLGRRHDEFVEALDAKELAATASHAQARDQRGVADLRRELGEGAVNFWTPAL